MKWTLDEDAELKECADAGLTAAETSIAVSALGNERTASGCQGRASKLLVSFSGSADMGLRSFLEEGGRLVREDVGGVIGIRWGRAHRCGSGFATPTCEAMLRLGLLRTDGNGDHIFRAVR